MESKYEDKFLNRNIQRVAFVDNNVGLFLRFVGPCIILIVE